MVKVQHDNHQLQHDHHRTNTAAVVVSNGESVTVPACQRVNKTTPNLLMGGDEGREP